jgi:hypothetical protein
MIQHNFGINFRKKIQVNAECQGQFWGEMRAVTTRSWYLRVDIEFSDVIRMRQKELRWVPVTWHWNTITKVDDDDNDDGDYSQIAVHLHLSLSNSLEGDQFEIA